MLLYAFYKVDLIDIAKGRHEHSAGFINDCAFVAVADTLNEAHAILKDMMEHSNGGLDWSHSYNLPFETLKLAIMDFARMPCDLAPNPLIINKPNPNRSVSTHTITTSISYKYLGIIFNPKLSWRGHITKVLASATKWSQQLWRIAKTAEGFSPKNLCQLYNTVAIPAITYASDIWYIPPYKLAHCRNLRGSIGATKLLQSLQGRTVRTITGGLCSTTYDILKVHAYIPPINLIFCKAQINVATHICTLPPAHPLFLIVHRAVCHFVNHHKSPLHYFFFTAQFNLQQFETITPSCRHPFYIPPFSTKVSHSKETALDLTNKSHHVLCYKVYCDSSSYEGGVRATAILYKNNCVLKSIQYKLGTPEEHTVYEVELVGIILALHLLMSLACQLVNTTLIGLDNQAAILALPNQSSKPLHYLLDITHDTIGRLHVKQDKLQNAALFHNTIHQGNRLTPRTNSIIDLWFQ